ncbi:Hypothetical_protein [Hexamita inflata]|uniref:Hypothetical_protein n=1 Tax=Hexamita inflata TaxID=28002 RepID=A0ABP1GIK6_9EUKA
MQADHSDTSDSFEIQCEESDDYSILSVQSNEQNEQIVENDENVNFSDNNQCEVTASLQNDDKRIQNKTFKQEDSQNFLTLKLSHVPNTDVEKIENYLKQFQNIKIEKLEKNKKERIKKVKKEVNEKKEVQKHIANTQTQKKEKRVSETYRRAQIKAQVAQQVDYENVDQFLVIIDLHDMPAETANKLEAALKPSIPQNCIFRTLAKGDLSIKCNQESLEQVKKAIVSYSTDLKFTQKPVKKRYASIMVNLDKYPNGAAQTLLPIIQSDIPASGKVFVKGVNIIIQIDPAEVKSVESYLKCIQFNDQEIQFSTRL